MLQVITVRRVGNSLGIIVPAEALRQLGLVEGSQVALQADGVSIMLEPCSSETAGVVQLFNDVVRDYAEVLRELSRESVAAGAGYPARSAPANGLNGVEDVAEGPAKKPWTVPTVKFMTVGEVMLVQRELVARMGGAAGVRDASGLEVAVMGARRLAGAEASAGPDLPRLAARLAYRLVNVAAFMGCNRRVAFVAMAIFLGRNGLGFAADPADVGWHFWAAESGQLDEGGFGSWIVRATAVAK